MAMTENIISFAASKEHCVFTRRELNDVFGSRANLSLARMLKDKRIVRIRRGEYSLPACFKRPFLIEPDDYMVKLHGVISEKFPFVEKCIWRPDVLVPYMLHVPCLQMYLVEIERVAVDSLFCAIEPYDASRRVLVNPGADDYGRYASGHPCIIIKPLVSQAPMSERNGVSVPSIEKILVDLTVGSPELAFASGSEMFTIYENVFERHDVNVRAMMRYAQRRGKASVVKSVIDSLKYDTERQLDK